VKARPAPLRNEHYARSLGTHKASMSNTVPEGKKSQIFPFRDSWKRGPVDEINQNRRAGTLRYVKRPRSGQRLWEAPESINQPCFTCAEGALLIMSAWAMAKLFTSSRCSIAEGAGFPLTQSAVPVCADERRAGGPVDDDTVAMLTCAIAATPTSR